ncbi:MAG: metalloregulator ArsR/SmtB family transcription factor [Candidatus Latescibacteria bacterium]|jgi:DNA-binding transcriptional ArsR family regulator|nr:metalloregulator ArsR/SmtB family transcription factor [Candidatus Latescibacterota bacterium]
MAFAFNTNSQPQDKFKFVVGLRFELFYALQTLTYRNMPACDDGKRTSMHSGWKQKTLKKLPQVFHDNFKALGGSPHFWPAIADALEHCPIEASFEDLISYLEALDPADFRESILVGTLHEQDIVDGLISGIKTLSDVSDNAAEQEQKWLEFLGLRPFQADADIVQAMNSLIHTPEAFKATLIDTLRIIWDVELKSVWESTYPLLVKSVEEKKRLFETYALPEFLERALNNDKTVTMKVDEENQTLVCCKGQFRIPFPNLGNFYLMPSIFNSMRFWTFYEYGKFTTIFLPYFEFDIAIDGDEIESEASNNVVSIPTNGKRVPEMNPSLIFKALGDNTRYAIISHIAQTPCTAAELSKILKVSKPTISHHVQLLREAGLLHEKPEARSVQLSLKREMIEHLSQATVGNLFSSAN